MDNYAHLIEKADNGPVPAATDIGYQSVDGATPVTSGSRYAFDPAANFAIAIDYDMSFSNNPTGNLGIGFGIGEDRDGANSAGAALLTLNGSPFMFASSAESVGEFRLRELPKCVLYVRV